MLGGISRQPHTSACATCQATRWSRVAFAGIGWARCHATLISISASNWCRGLGLLPARAAEDAEEPATEENAGAEDEAEVVPATAVVHLVKVHILGEERDH